MQRFLFHSWTSSISRFFILAILLGLVGCTSVSVRPIASELQLKEVLIVENPKVEVADFLPLLTDGFKRHGIDAKVVPASTDINGAFVITYSAYRVWDFAWYLSDATIILSKDGRKIALAVYHLKAGGGFAPGKWIDTKSKINPVIDEMLKDYPVVR